MRVWLSDVFAIDTRSLAVFRVGLAVTILGDLANRALDLGAHYTDTGVLPRALLAAEVGSRIPWAPVLLRLQPHFVFGTLPGQALVFAAAAVVAALLLVGWRTRWVTVVSWILLTSLHGRNPGVMNTGDGVLRLLLFWSMFLPLGARWSLDAAARRGPDGYRVIGGGAVALLLQIAFIYVFAAIFKTGAAWTTNYTALEMALGGQWVSAWGERLLQYPELLQLMTRFVIGLERFGWILLFFPFLNGPARTLPWFYSWRSTPAFCCVCRSSIFAVVCIVAWLAVLPPWFWNTLSGREATVRRQPSFACRAGRAPLRSGSSGTCSCGTCSLLGGGIRPRIFDAPAYLLRVDQRWNMFSPQPPARVRYMAAFGKTADRATVDLLNGTPAGDPRPATGHYHRARWRNYFGYRDVGGLP